MSIRTQADRIQANIAAAYAAASAKGATLPTERNSDNLPQTVQSIIAANEIPAAEPAGGVANVAIDTANDTVTITIPTDIAGKDILCLGTGISAMMAGGTKTMDYFLILIDDGAIYRSARIGYNGSVPFLKPSVTASLSGNDIILSGVSSDYQTYVNYTIWAEIQYGM